MHPAKEALDRLEDVLAKEAALAGLLNHGPMTGNAREFFVRRMLRAILPPSVHVGSGRVISGQAHRQSRQIDVIIYDPRFPMLEVTSGVGMYFLEGVIATIEVKSTLDGKELRASLDNCASVSELEPFTRDCATFCEFVRRVEVEHNLPCKEAKQYVLAQASPATYIFAFDSRFTHNRTGHITAQWYADRGESPGRFRTCLPRLIATRACVGFHHDDQIHFGSFGSNPEFIAKYGPIAQPVMGFWKSDRYFGVLALHLMNAIGYRLGLTHAHLDLSLFCPLPMPEYIEAVDSNHPTYVVWTGGKAPAMPVSQPAP